MHTHAHTHFVSIVRSWESLCLWLHCMLCCPASLFCRGHIINFKTSVSHTHTSRAHIKKIICTECSSYHTTPSPLPLGPGIKYGKWPCQMPCLRSQNEVGIITQAWCWIEISYGDNSNKDMTHNTTTKAAGSTNAKRCGTYLPNVCTN